LVLGAPAGRLFKNLVQFTWHVSWLPRRAIEKPIFPAVSKFLKAIAMGARAILRINRPVSVALIFGHERRELLL
jgi:hypothetical protein